MADVGVRAARHHKDRDQNVATSGGIVMTLARRAVSILVVALVAGACASSAPTVGPATPTPPATNVPGDAFTVTGSMATPRWSHHAVRLTDGRVLMLAGLATRGTDYVAACEIYDPKTGSFATTASLRHATMLMEVLPLPNGRVLVAHELDLGWEIDEAYDPATGEFLAVGPVTYSGGTTPVVLGDGRILLAGGVMTGSDPTPLATASIYDPNTGKTVATGSMHTPRSGAGAVLLKDGRVLMIGGLRDATAELYDPVTGTFTPTGSMDDMRVFDSVVLLRDGRVLIAGGQVGKDWSNTPTALLYDPVSGKFTATGSMSVTRVDAQPVLLADGRVLLVGGASGWVGLAYEEIYDPGTGTFSKTRPSISPRVSATATLLASGKVLIAGGSGPDDKPVAPAELFQP
jgi:hypothetical protein